MLLKFIINTHDNPADFLFLFIGRKVCGLFYFKYSLNLSKCSHPWKRKKCHAKKTHGKGLEPVGDDAVGRKLSGGADGYPGYTDVPAPVEAAHPGLPVQSAESRPGALVLVLRAHGDAARCLRLQLRLYLPRAVTYRYTRVSHRVSDLDFEIFSRDRETRKVICMILYRGGDYMMLQRCVWCYGDGLQVERKVKN